MLMLPRCLLAVAAVVFSLEGVAQTADTYPNKPIRVVVPVVAGGQVHRTAVVPCDDVVPAPAVSVFPLTTALRSS